MASVAVGSVIAPWSSAEGDSRSEVVVPVAGDVRANGVFDLVLFIYQRLGTIGC